MIEQRIGLICTSDNQTKSGKTHSHSKNNSNNLTKLQSKIEWMFSEELFDLFEYRGGLTV